MSLGKMTPHEFAHWCAGVVSGKTDYVSTMIERQLKNVDFGDLNERRVIVVNMQIPENASNKQIKEIIDLAKEK